MAKKGMRKSVIIIILIIVCVVAGVMCFAWENEQIFTMAESDSVISNPYIGYAPAADNEDACKTSRLVYINLRWADWETNEGYYDVDFLESQYHISEYATQGKHGVLRFVCDIPRSQMHMDIPQWLYEKTGDGTIYDTTYGKGYSPNYSNPTFRKAHEKALEALAAYCNQSDFVAYVQLGSLGHWGEWHTNVSEGVMDLPSEEICREYVDLYVNSFTNAALMMRRNYTMAADNNLGLFNDMVGHVEETEEWLDWIYNGGSYMTDSITLNYTIMDSFWEKAPVGGELNSTYPMEELLGGRFEDTMKTIEDSHLSFLGPMCPTDEYAMEAASDEILKKLGYRIYISQIKTKSYLFSDYLDLTLTWENTGIAPMYKDWPVTVYIYDSEGEELYKEVLDLKLSELLPRGQQVTTTQIPKVDLAQGFEVGIQIQSPDGSESITLAQKDCQITDGNINRIKVSSN